MIPEIIILLMIIWFRGDDEVKLAIAGYYLVFVAATSPFIVLYALFDSMRYNPDESSSRVSKRPDRL